MSDEYRYSLTRELDGDRRRACWVMLNPSTADQQTDDPTIRRVIGFTRRMGFGRLQVVNLFAQRATDPRDLRSPDEDVWLTNLVTVQEAISDASRVIAAWGATVPRQAAASVPMMVAAISRTAAVLGRSLWCLGKNVNGSPRHPLYVNADEPLVAWP